MKKIVHLGLVALFALSTPVATYGMWGKSKSDENTGSFSIPTGFKFGGDKETLAAIEKATKALEVTAQIVAKATTETAATLTKAPLRFESPSLVQATKNLDDATKNLSNITLTVDAKDALSQMPKEIRLNIDTDSIFRLGQRFFIGGTGFAISIAGVALAFHGVKNIFAADDMKAAHQDPETKWEYTKQILTHKYTIGTAQALTGVAACAAGLYTIANTDSILTRLQK